MAAHDTNSGSGSFLTEAANAWMQQDQEAATGWQQGSDLSPEAREKVTAPPQVRASGGFGDFIPGDGD